MKIHEFENVEAWAAHLSSVLSKDLTLHGWVRELSSGIEPLDTLLEAWIWFHLRFGELISSEGMLPELREFEDFGHLTEIISAWCECEARFDSSPFLQHIEGLQRMWDRSEAGMTVEIPEAQWNQLCEAGWDALRLTRRIRLHLAGKFTGESQAAAREIKFHKAVDGIEGLSKETLAIGLLFTMSDPSVAKIASALGYKNHSGLQRMAKFQFARHCRDVGRTFQSGNHRPAGQRRNGRPMESRDESDD